MAVLIDLHVRPLWLGPGAVDSELLAVQLRDHGLDGALVADNDEAVHLGDTVGLLEETGVLLVAGVALATDDGATLLCVPRVADEWYRSAGWRPLRTATAAAYPVAQVVAEFTGRGGAVVALVPEGNANWSVPAGVSALAVLRGGSAPIHDAAARMAHRARIASVGGSGCEPGTAQFGRAATLLAASVSTQEGLVEALRSGRAWPVEIGVEWARKSQPAPDPRKAQPAPAAPQRPPPDRPEAESSGAARPAHPTPEAAPRPTAAKGHAAAKQRSRYDVPERPGDNRGNRLNRDEILRALWTPAHGDDNQPNIDPVAMMYGVESRRQHRRQHYNDQDLDRTFNGNRARSPDPNVMALPSFEEMRPDRQQIQVLFAPNEEKHDLEGSVALRFAMAGLRRAAEENGNGPGDHRGYGKRGHHHGHRKRR
ncbi:MAG: hypothetical protein FJ100_04735 [Deltaproteobacteria bacterium]|nr:hypothetical protein [Deltaproteobacteria bacterium]